MKNIAYFFNNLFVLDLLLPVDRLTAEAKLSGDILHSSLNSNQQSLKVREETSISVSLLQINLSHFILDINKSKIECMTCFEYFS